MTKDIVSQLEGLPAALRKSFKRAAHKIIFTVYSLLPSTPLTCNSDIHNFFKNKVTPLLENHKFLYLPVSYRSYLTHKLYILKIHRINHRYSETVLFWISQSQLLFLITLTYSSQIRSQMEYSHLVVLRFSVH